jgi:hypothetical protein
MKTMETSPLLRFLQIKINLLKTIPEIMEWSLERCFGTKCVS